MLELTSILKPAIYIYLYIALVINSIYYVDTVELPCDKTRKLFNSTWGIISHGPPSSNYTQDSHCEWLVKACKNEYITLTFHKMSTECSYDYLYVYGGDTLTSPLLGSFSGRNQPQQVTSDSGSMLILLYSDANYVLEGFVAEYSITQCPMNCSGHGTCIKNECECEPGWNGLDCGHEICPDDCGSNFGRGTCFEAKCQCSDGFSGQACDLNKNDSIGSSSWYLLSSGENSPPKRAAHIAVYVKEMDSFYIFGGYDLNNVLGDLYAYNFNRSTWHHTNGNQSAASKIKNIDKQIFHNNNNNKNDIYNNNVKVMNTRRKKPNKYMESNESIFEPFEMGHHTEIINEEFAADDIDKMYKVYVDSDFLADQRLNESYGVHWKINDVEQGETPSPRYGHAASRYPGGFVIYGGKKSDGSLSDELWYYNVSSQKWSLRAKFSVLLPPGLTRHTLTLVKDDVLYLFGGSTSNGEFSSKLYKIKLHPDIKQEQWKHIRPRGGKGIDVRVVGHSTVYYSNTNSLIVFGGITTGLARLSKLSDRMYIFKISSRYWSEIHYLRAHLPDSYVPRERAFHSAVILGNYLVIFGGYSHRHNKEEICYDNHMYIYHLGCHTWISQEVFNSSRKKSHSSPWTVDAGGKYLHGRGQYSHMVDYGHYVLVAQEKECRITPGFSANNMFASVV